MCRTCINTVLLVVTALGVDQNTELNREKEKAQKRTPKENNT